MHTPSTAIRRQKDLALTLALCALGFTACTPSPPPDLATADSSITGAEDGAPNSNQETQGGVESWAQWRGPLGTGASPTATPPIHWSEDKNVRFKVPLPGLGHSTPVQWGDRLFLTTAVPDDERVTPRYSDAPGAHDNRPIEHWVRFDVLALDTHDGWVHWQKTVHRALPHEAGHFTASLASASPVTDGRRVYAFFGSHGLYALDVEDGSVVWQRQLGTMHTKHAHGEGSSPALHGDTLIVNWDHEGDSFLVALDTAHGEERWKVPRDEVTSWASPIVVEHDGVHQVIVSGTERVRAYDLRDGREIWQCGGLSANVVASPVAGDGMVFVASSYDTRALMAIRLEGSRGDITGTSQVVWQRAERTPYVPSPLLYEGHLYFLRHYQGILSRLVTHDGSEPSGPFRLRGLRDIYASPVAADGRIYITDRHGTTFVVSAGETPEILAVNRLEDAFSASAVLSGRTLYLRGEAHLYALETPESPVG